MIKTEDVSMGEEKIIKVPYFLAPSPEQAG